MLRTLKSSLAVAALIFIAASPALAQATDATKPMALREVMDKLGRDMQTVTGAIAKEDWALVAELAPKIAHHAEPPIAEKARILTWLGSDAATFRSHDGETHEAAAAMGAAAKRGDGQGVITAFAKVQQSCLACHQSFRRPFVEHFYEKH